MSWFPPKNVLVPVALGERDSGPALRHALWFRKMFGSRLYRNAGASSVYQIIDRALSLSADLIILDGSRGSIKDYVFSSLPELAIRESIVPVMCVRTEPRPIHSVAAVMDFEQPSEGSVLYAALVASVLSADLKLLSVANNERERAASDAGLRQLMIRLTARFPVACRTKIKTIVGTPEEGVRELNGKCDLIVAPCLKRKYVHDYIKGTFSECILKSAPVPVIGVPCEDIAQDQQSLTWEPFAEAAPLL